MKTLSSLKKFFPVEMHFDYLIGFIVLIIFYFATQNPDDDDDQGGGMMIPSYQGN